MSLDREGSTVAIVFAHGYNNNIFNEYLCLVGKLK